MTKSFYDLSIDATKVASLFEGNSAYGIFCGAAAPNHIKNATEGEQWVLTDSEMASELKCAILTAQQSPKNVTPFKIIAARPQTTNERCDDFNWDCVNAVCRIMGSHGNLLSVAFDGLSAENIMIRDIMLKFLEGKTNIVALVDPNHVGKAVRSQLVLGGSFVTIGQSYFDVGLLQIAGIARNLYRVDDFTSDAVVLKLCSAESVEKMANACDREDKEATIATAVSLMFLRLFVVVCSSSTMPKRHAIAILWSCMLYFTSIDISTTTKRNVVAAVIPIICLLTQKAVTKIRLLTSEPAEHYFGCACQKKREFTVSDFLMYVESLEIALQEMVEFNFRSAGGTGYVSTFSGFLKSIIDETSTSSTTFSTGSAAASFEGVDVQYDHPTLLVAQQIEEEITSDINTATEFLVAFLMNGLNFKQGNLSPFTKHFTSMIEIAHSYYYYLSPDTRAQLVDHIFSPPQSQPPGDQETEFDPDAVATVEIDVEDISRTLSYAVNIALHDNGIEGNMHYTQFIPHGLERAPTDAVRIHESDGTVDSEDVCSWTELCQAWGEICSYNMGTQNLSKANAPLFLISTCMKKAKQILNVSTSSIQKYQSLKGRWWGQAELIADQGSTDSHLKRGMVFMHKSRMYKILNVLKKSYNKWRVEEYGPASKNTRVHAVSIVADRMVQNRYGIDRDCDQKLRCISLNGDKVAPFAMLHVHGWIQANQLS